MKWVIIDGQGRPLQIADDNRKGWICVYKATDRLLRIGITTNVRSPILAQSAVGYLLRVVMKILSIADPL